MNITAKSEQNAYATIVEILIYFPVLIRAEKMQTPIRKIKQKIIKIKRNGRIVPSFCRKMILNSG